MKGLAMEDGNASSSVGYELQRLRRGVRMAQLMSLVLGLLVLVLLIALAAVGASQAKKIDNLKAGNDGVFFGVHSRSKEARGATYAGSLFRGSGFWATRAVLPGALADHSAVGVNDEVYILGGESQNGTVVSQVLKYDPTLHNYTLMAPMPGPRYRFGATLLDNGNADTIYVVGGRRDSLENTTSTINSIYIYNIPTNTWSIGPDAPIVMSDTCAGSVAGKVYAIGGYDETYGLLAANYVYDPATKAWSKLADMPTPRGDHMCVSTLGEVYALGGFYDPTFKANAFSNKMESFNPVTGAWTTRTDLLTPRGDGGAVVLPGNRIMVVGGEGQYDNNSNWKYPKHVNEVYYIDDETWVQKAFIPTARFRTAAAAAGGLAFVIGGADVCIDAGNSPCPILNVNEVFLDVDHPHVYIYLKNENYNDTAPTTIYPL